MIRLENLTKIYKTTKGEVNALDGIDLEIKKGEFVVLCGPSGSGKTTLLMEMAGIQQPTSGSVCIGQDNIYKMSVSARTKFRAENIGCIFQMFYLIPYLNVIENVSLARGALGSNLDQTGATELLKSLCMEHRILHKPAQLSVGEKQRTAVARALFNQPQIILADEPIANLDEHNAHIVLEQIYEFHKKGGTVIFVTHEDKVEQFAERIIHLKHGHVHEQ